MVVAKGLRWFIFIMRITDWVRWAYFFVVKQNENLLYFCCWHFGLQSQGAGKVLQSIKSSPWDSFRHDKVSCFAWPELSLNWWWLVTVPLRFNQFKFPSDSCSRDSLFLWLIPATSRSSDLLDLNHPSVTIAGWWQSFIVLTSCWRAAQGTSRTEFCLHCFFLQNFSLTITMESIDH